MTTTDTNPARHGAPGAPSDRRGAQARPLPA